MKIESQIKTTPIKMKRSIRNERKQQPKTAYVKTKQNQTKTRKNPIRYYIIYCMHIL